MAKKKKRSKSPTLANPTKRDAAAGVRRILVRVPIDLADWIDGTAAEVRLSRDAFLRIQLEGLREGFELARQDTNADASLFRSFEDRMAKIAEQAIDSAVKEVIRTTGGVARVKAKHP